ncbi:MAG: ribonuclease D [Verrucomicrobiota bacterium]|nr:ribonuclease D [Verrucomicrobiota bacterium]
MKRSPDETHLIDRPSMLEEVMQVVASADEIALDTEADSMHAYPEKICLLQIRAQGNSWLVDPLADLDCSGLMEILSDKSLIFHAADYDLRLLYRRFRFRPRRVFDTMWAARLVGYQRFGLEFLVKHFFDIQLEKGPQTANWGLRPLTPSMAQYALNDVFFLHSLTDLLRKELQDMGRLTWLNDICHRVVDQACRGEKDDSDIAWRLKGSQKLTPRGLAFMKAIWLWREKEAVRANRPPFFVLTHDLVTLLSSKAALNEDWRASIPRKMSSRRRHELEKLIQSTGRLEMDQFPQKLKHSRLRATDQEKMRAEELRQIRDKVADELKLDPSIIASKALLTRLGLEHSSAKGELMPWQRELLGLSLQGSSKTPDADKRSL